MMFNRPDRSKPQFLGQPDLFHHLQEVTALLGPRYTARHLPFVKKSEFHLVLQVSMAGRQLVRAALAALRLPPRYASVNSGVD
jgi:hypothetical protein